MIAEQRQRDRRFQAQAIEVKILQVFSRCYLADEAREDKDGGEVVVHCNQKLHERPLGAICIQSPP